MCLKFFIVAPNQKFKRSLRLYRQFTNEKSNDYCYGPKLFCEQTFKGAKKLCFFNVQKFQNNLKFQI